MESFDFGQVEVKNNTYLQPGHYKLKITASKYVIPEGKKNDGTAKTPYVEITFSGEAGSVTEKFFVTPKALERLQYLHMQWFGAKCEKPFKDANGVGLYFEKVMMAKPNIVKGICVGGKKAANGKVYANLPFSNFILPDEMNFEEGPFAEDSVLYRLYVTVEKNASSNTDEIMLPANSTSSNDDVNDDLPF